ncbi:MAG TPA: TMEM43 family protein [Luteimonas sp.]|nr:TMEM43 family protein [Luteimonas sp.]
MRRWWCAAALLVFAGSALAQDESIDAPQPDKSVRDAEFGVVARHFGLERQVEMYQWRPVGQGPATAWSAQPFDSTGFPPGHANPPFPLHGRRWLARSVSIDDKPLDAEVIASLGQWRDFRPSFAALPGNLAATFQPEGDGLGSAENPLDPQIGDLRIRWRELILPPLQGRIALRGGRWRLLAGKPATASAPDASDTAVDTARPRRAPWLFGSGVVVVLLAAIAARRRRRESLKQSGE